MNLSGAIDEIESQRSFQFSLFENIVHKQPLRGIDMPALVELMRGDIRWHRRFDCAVVDQILIVSGHEI